MLRLLVLALLLANGVYAAWGSGLLAPYGFAPANESEPQRLLQQIRPEAMRLMPLPETRPASPAEPQASAPAAAAGIAPGAGAECLQAGLFNEEQTAVLRARLQDALPAGSWVLESSIEPARWMVYMGKYSSAEAMAKKRSELRQLRVPFEPLNNPALEPGLSLGTFGSELEANAELARVSGRGVHSARVILALAEYRGQKLRLPAVQAGLRPQLEALKAQLAGKPLQACT